jgi:hypothetical protein
VTSVRESLQEKALRLIRDGHVQVVWVDAERIEARVRGSDREHVVGYERGGWRCSCEAHRFGQRCSHLAATQMVTRRPIRQPAGLTAAMLRQLQDEATATRNGSGMPVRRPTVWEATAR